MKTYNLNNLSVRSKLILFLLIPVLAVLFFSYTGFKEKYQQLQNAKQVEDFTRISKILADLIYELQNERGLSAGFITSRGRSFKTALQKQRYQTDVIHRQFSDKLGEIGPVNDYWGLNKKFAQFSDGLILLVTLRDRIDKRVAIDVFEYFSDLNAQAISLMYDLTVLINDTSLIRQHESLLLLVWLQERAAQQRGVLTGVLSSGKLDAKNLWRISFYSSDQTRLLRKFYTVASIEQQALLKERLTHPFVLEVATIQRAILNKSIKSNLLNELQYLLGFGGLIHDFKNYVIRNEQIYQKQFKQKFVKLKDIIEQYRNISRLSQNEHTDLAVIEKHIVEYAKKLQLVTRLKKTEVTIQKNDMAVKINDSQVMLALDNLHKTLIDLDKQLWWDKATHLVQLYDRMSAEHGLTVLNMADRIKMNARFSLYTYGILMFFVLAVSSMLAWMLMQRLVGEVKGISKSIRKMETGGNYNQLLTVSGTDEIGEMAAAFNSLIRERNKSENEQVHLQLELQQAQKMESLGQLTGGIAHDFNNILAAILGFAELGLEVSNDIGEEKLSDYLNEVLSAGLRGKNLVAQMLTYSRQQTINDKPLQLSHLFDENLSLLRSSLPSSISIETDFEEHLPLTLMNPTQMTQILMNLSINARDAMQGKGALSFKLYWARDLDKKCVASHKIIQGDWLALSARDTGSGINLDIISEIFDPFFTTKDVGKGTGMGLSVVYGIVRSHNGYILLDSEPDIGSTFILLFPPYLENATATLEPA